MLREFEALHGADEAYIDAVEEHYQQQMQEAEYEDAYYNTLAEERQKQSRIDSLQFCGTHQCSTICDIDLVRWAMARDLRRTKSFTILDVSMSYVCWNTGQRKGDASVR